MASLQLQYLSSADADTGNAELVYKPIYSGPIDNSAIEDGQRHFPFVDKLLIGRMDAYRAPVQGILLIDDTTVSTRHCIITWEQDGRFLIRDVSRNGTLVNGRRLVPNVEFSLNHNDVIKIGPLELYFQGKDRHQGIPMESTVQETVLTATASDVTVLVGDIRNYTMMVQQVAFETLQRNINKVFRHLEGTVIQCGGMLKEYQGDAIFAYWSAAANSDSAHIKSACLAAMKLHQQAQQLAGDPAVWSVDQFPLQFDWALASGPVLIDTMGGNQVKGLSMVGEPVVKAFRLEKTVTDTTGPIVACLDTWQATRHDLLFKYLGKHEVKGFSEPEPIYALISTR